MKKLIRWIVINSLIPLFLYLHFSHGGDGWARLAVALVIVDFCVRSFFGFVLSIGCVLPYKKGGGLEKKVESGEFKPPVSSVPRSLDFAYDVILWGVLVYIGWNYCAVMYFVATVFQHIGIAAIKKIIRDYKAASEAEKNAAPVSPEPLKPQPYV